MTSTGPKQVTGLVLDAPPSRMINGGLNSTLNANSAVTLAQPLMPGQAININLRFEYAIVGSYNFALIAEAN